MKSLMLIVAAVGAGVLSVGCDGNRTGADYEQTRIRVMESLARSTSAHPQGVSVRPLHARLPIFPETVRGDYDWRGVGGFGFGLDIDEDYLNREGEYSSLASPSAALLEHYFGGLEKAGLRCAGTPSGGTDYPFEWAGNHWYLPENRIVVWGFVFIDRSARRAWVMGQWVAE